MERTAEDVQVYLDALVRRNRYKDWQLQQANEALRLLLGEYLALPWTRPWPVRIAPAPLEQEELQSGQSAQRRKKEVYQDVPNWDGLELRFPSLLTRMRTALRTLHYAYRTEQSYVEWMCRFLNFRGRSGLAGNDRHLCLDGQSPLRERLAAHGMCTATGQRY